MSTNRLSIKNSNSILLIAPCGMNCTVCYAYQRNKNHCPGCRIDFEQKTFSCINCRIKNCKNINNSSQNFCFECESFPCKILKYLDKRYRTKYNMSMIENLEFIKKNGLIKFIVGGKKRWACSNCGGNICAHKMAALFVVIKYLKFTINYLLLREYYE